jgi:hypothetical protein
MSSAVKSALVVRCLSAAFLCVCGGWFFLTAPDRIADAVFMSVAQVNQTVNAQGNAIRSDLNALALTTERDANGKLGEALDIVRRDSAAALYEIHQARQTITYAAARADYQLTLANGILGAGEENLAGENGSVTATLRQLERTLARYQQIPDDIAGDKIFKAYEAQGLGVLGATKVFMGDAARAGRTFDQHFPALMDSATGITADVHTFTGNAVKPRGTWGTVKDILTVGAGLGRLAK